MQNWNVRYVLYRGKQPGMDMWKVELFCVGWTQITCLMSAVMMKIMWFWQKYPVRQLRPWPFHCRQNHTFRPTMIDLESDINKTVSKFSTLTNDTFFKCWHFVMFFSWQINFWKIKVVQPFWNVSSLFSSWQLDFWEVVEVVKWSNMYSTQACYIAQTVGAFACCTWPWGVQRWIMV